jgi:hypothetical protein
MGAVSTVERVHKMQDLMETYDEIDLWILDHGINDAIGGGGSYVASFVTQSEHGAFKISHDVLGNITGDDIQSIATEALILKILSIDPTASLMMLATACAECLPFREKELKIARHYRIPYVDYAFLVEQRGKECDAVEVPVDENGALLYPDVNIGYSRARHCALWEGAVHPDWQTHQNVADAIGYLMGRALSALCKGSEKMDEHTDYPLTAARTFMPAQTFWAATALHSLSPCEDFLTSFSASSASIKSTTISSDGWNLMEDRKGKPGWIATEAGARIAFPVAFGNGTPTVGIAFLRSYENMGQASIQILGRGGESFPLGEINGLWDSEQSMRRVSTADTQWYRLPKVKRNTNMSLIVEITNLKGRYNSTRDSHKMKILNVMSC